MLTSDLFNQWKKAKELGHLDSCNSLVKCATNLGQSLINRNSNLSFPNFFRNGENSLRGARVKTIGPVEPKVKMLKEVTNSKEEAARKSAPLTRFEFKEEKTTPDALSYQSATK